MDLLIVERLDAQVLQWLQQRLRVQHAPGLWREPRALRQALRHARALMASPALHVDAALLQQAPALCAVGVLGGDGSTIDAEACRDAGVELLPAGAGSAPAEAEFVVAALLALLRRVPVLTEDGVRVGRELGGITVGLIGVGATTSALLPLLQAFGARSVGYDPAVHASDPLWSRWGVLPLPLRELVELSDAVCVMLPYYTRYRGLIGERVLPYARPDQVWVSLAPVSLFDEHSLADALHSGRLAAAWLDDAEPDLFGRGQPLHGIETLQVTPRLAGLTRESRRRSAWTLARRLVELLGDGAPPASGFSPTQPGGLPARADLPASG
jgi:phosphoglycerate dehydrogenase-like enzyme